MAKKTRTELSTLAINTNLPDNTTELITPTTERAQLTDERESVVNYKDDLGGATNAGKFLTVAVDGESLTMVDEPSGVPAWVTFQTAASNLMKLLSGTNNVQIQFFYDDAGVDTLGARISFLQASKTLLIINDFYTAQLSISNQFNFIQGGFVKLRIEATGDLTHNADIMALNAQQSFGSSPLYTFKFQGKVTGPSGGAFTFEEFANIKGGKENATENDKAGYLSFTTGIADGTLTERLRISSTGTATFSGDIIRKGNVGNISFEGGSVTNINAQIQYDQVSDYVGQLFFKTANGSGTLATRLTITSGGKITFDNNLRYIEPVATGDTMRISQNSFAPGGLQFGLDDGTSFSPKISIGSNWVSNLDAYEEGTWTPSISDMGNISSIVVTKENYTRIGNLVTCAFEFSGTIASSSSETSFSFTTPFIIHSNNTPFVGHAGFYIGTGANRFGVGSVYEATSSNVKTFIYMAANQTNAAVAFSNARMTLTYQTT